MARRDGCHPYVVQASGAPMAMRMTGMKADLPWTGAPVQGTCVFTIVSRNYLPFARTLMDSVARHAPEMDRVVCLCDAPEGLREDEERFRLLPVEELDLPQKDRFLFRYTVLELNTAIKPFVFRTLLNQAGYGKVIYFDPDILVYDALEGVSDGLDRANLLLTPHLTERLPEDHRKPSEREILHGGAYNLGFAAVRAGETTDQLLAWWENKLERDCVVDPERGYFVDQKWMDLAPGLFDGVLICREPGWNVAYWNLPHRRVEEAEGRIRVNGRPLVFFHFSGIRPEENVYSQHQDRYRVETLPEAVRRQYDAYCSLLRANGYERCRGIPYAFGAFHDGTRIPAFARKVFREEWEGLQPTGRLTEAETQEAVIRFVNQCPDGYRYLSRGALAYYRLRPDLQHHFTHLDHGDEADYAEWFVGNIREQDPEVDDRFVRPVRDRLADRPARPTGGRSASPAAAWAGRAVYRLAWATRRLFYPVTTVAFRRRINDLLLSRAYALTGRTVSRRSTVPPAAPMGVNVAGYLTSESGVGQAGRAAAAAARAAGIPCALRTIERGSVSPKRREPGYTDSPDTPHPINLLHFNADQVPLMRTELGPGFFSGRYNIGVWYWELPEFPDAWQGSFDGFDEIWAGSAFCQRAIAARSPAPVVHMPPCLVVPEDPPCCRGELGLPEDAFLFVTMADGLSFLERKNPLGAIRAFLEAFPDPAEGVVLVVKLINAAADEGPLGELRALADGHPSIAVRDEHLDRLRLTRFIASADAFVSLHRSEGFGLPLAEAMYFGKPVVATGWSGNMDFMTPWNSLPVRYEMARLDADVGPYGKGQWWAEPDLDHAAACLRRVVRDREEAARLGRRAAADMRRGYTPAVCGARMRRRLEWILARDRAGGPAAPSPG